MPVTVRALWNAGRCDIILCIYEGKLQSKEKRAMTLTDEEAKQRGEKGI